MKVEIEEILEKALGPEYIAGTVEFQTRSELGHYTTPIAMRLAKEAEMSPRVIAENLKDRLEDASPAGFFEKIEVAGAGFINLWLADDIVRARFFAITQQENFGGNDSLKGEKVMVEYTDPNPFKEFHIGHLMTNVIGESLARVCEASGAKVFRANYQGDVGLHVASSVWGMIQLADEMPANSASLPEKASFLGRAYAHGIKSAKEDSSAKEEIEAINKKVYDRSDGKINEMYDRGRGWSLEYFETIYARLGTKFTDYFFESEMGPEGLAIVQAHPEVFVPSEGAIVFPGEKYGLHTRVFVNKFDLPTYEAKELGLNKNKFEKHKLNRSYIVTGNDINAYFEVLMKAMELVLPQAASKTKHISHGMLRLPSGKMSSRTGEIITAEHMIEEVKRAVQEKLEEREGLSEADREEIKEKVSLAAIRYSILRQGIGKDIIFDLKNSTAFHGDSGPYLQYTYARLRRVVAKSAVAAFPIGTISPDLAELKTEDELDLIRKMLQFPDQVKLSLENLSVNNIAEYLHELANFANRFYEGEHILEDGNHSRQAARLLLADTAARVLARGMNLLGIEILESI